MRVLVATDAWHPQVNGVVRTYEGSPSRRASLASRSSSSRRRTSARFPAQPIRKFACRSPARAPSPRTSPTRTGLHPYRHRGADRADDEALLPQEPLAVLHRYHTRFPEYVSARLPMPKSLVLSRSSGDSITVRQNTASSARRHRRRASRPRLHHAADALVTRGRHRIVPPGLVRAPRPTRPVFLYVGRIAVEKNIGAFSIVDLPGTKLVVGGGPQAAKLKAESSGRGVRRPEEGGEELARACSPPPTCSCFQPHRHLRPRAARGAGERHSGRGVPGDRAPKDVLTDPESGAMDWDLKAAMQKALELDRHAARAHALCYSWENSARQFIDNVLIAHHRKLPERRRRWRRNRQKKAARLGGNRAASLSCVHFGDAWGISRPPRNG